MDQQLDYAINHLFLPPKLPQSADTDVELEQTLLKHIANCVKTFCQGLRHNNVDNVVQNYWGLLQRTLDNFADIHGSGNLSKEHIQQVINGM
ncbi:hypothetical protein B0H12DRAFT_1091594 [Mycena haematopus]|nr:hypothetical protein B0H12DRAFT_1091594 [Mycena haematopus]